LYHRFSGTESVAKAARVPRQSCLRGRRKVTAGTAALRHSVRSTALGREDGRQKKPLQRNKADEPCVCEHVVASFARLILLLLVARFTVCAASSKPWKIHYGTRKGEGSCYHVLHAQISADVTASRFSVSWRRLPFIP